jgi:hypothetical protein
MPTAVAAIRDAAVAGAHGEGPRPRNLQKLFDWLFWNGGEADFDHPCFSIGSLNLSDADLRDDLGLGEGEEVTDEQRLQFARRQIDRLCSDGEGLSYAHAFRIERSDGKHAFLCGTSWMAGQGGHQTNCDGLYSSQRHHLQWLKQAGMSSDDDATITIAEVLAHWTMEPCKGA